MENNSVSLNISQHSQKTVGDGKGLFIDKKFRKPLAHIMPPKYSGSDVTEMFPHFRPGRPLRFLKLFGPGKPSSLPQTWKRVQKHRENEKVRLEVKSADEKLMDQQKWNFISVAEPDKSGCIPNTKNSFCKPVDAVKTVRNEDDHPRKDRGRNVVRSGQENIWRHGPAQLWFDMLDVPDEDPNFDYGFKRKQNDCIQKSAEESAVDEEENGTENKNRVNKGTGSFPEESFYMTTQLDWESNIIWDPSDNQHKKFDKNRAAEAGWVPSGHNRKTKDFYQRGKEKSETSIRENQNEENWCSIFPIETPELVNGSWEEDIIWDCEEMEKIPEPKILSLDPNDENIVLNFPKDLPPNRSKDNKAPLKNKIPHPHLKKSKLLLKKTGMIKMLDEDIPPSSPKIDNRDPYNISNDQYYRPKFSRQSLLKVRAIEKLQHSIPALQLQDSLISKYVRQPELRDFHRPVLRKYNNAIFARSAPQPIIPLTKHIMQKRKQREQESLAAGGGNIFFMRTQEDLSGKDGELILIEYSEEHPPLLNQVGMCSKIKNYYKRKACMDAKPPEHKYGETFFAHTSPFIGVMHPGQSIQTLENNMYRVPIYEHPATGFDFLVITTRTSFFIREFDGIFTAGQECPLFEVPRPNSKKAIDFAGDFLKIFIYRLFWMSEDNPRKIKMQDIARAFPMLSDNTIRKKLNLCANFKRTGVDQAGFWVIKPEFRLPTEEEIRTMVSPEQCCAHLSRIAAEQRLKDAGYGANFLFGPEEEDDENQLKIEDEVKAAPWNTTRAYTLAMRGKCHLQLVGPADPTGCGEGFSYIKVPRLTKTQLSKDEQEAQPKILVNGTDADLRKLSVTNARRILQNFGVPVEEIKKLTRWEIVDVVRTLSTEKTKAGIKGANKFSRRNPYSWAEQHERYNEECQRIFEIQNRVLQSGEVLSTDEGESSEDESSDLEEMGRYIESMLSNKKTFEQVNHEMEEQERLELQKTMMGGGKDEKDDDKGNKKSKNKENEDNGISSGVDSYTGRILKIHRTFKGADGKEFTRTEIVRQPAVIDIYMRMRKTKDEAFIRQFSKLGKKTKEEIVQRRRLTQQLRQIKITQQKRMTQPRIPRKKRSIRSRLNPRLKMTCGVCGQSGHMKTNRACPLYKEPTPPVPSPNVSISQEQKEDEVGQQLFLEDKELVKVDGTKIQLSARLMQHANRLKIRALMQRETKSILPPVGRKPNRKRPATSLHCDYLNKKSKTVSRKRTDPLVLIGGMFEVILNELRTIPDSHPFHLPVNKKVPRYYDIILKPMDLQTMREKIRQNKYQTRSDFLTDVHLIVDNCSTYNGSKDPLTECSRNMLELCKNRLQEKAEQFIKLERMINPLLYDDEQMGFNYILENAMIKIRAMTEVYSFLKPVNKRVFNDYYEIVSSPMDLETMHTKIKGNKYQNRFEFLKDLDLIKENSAKYNGANSTITDNATRLVRCARDFLEQFDEHLGTLEKNIRKGKDRAMEGGDSSISLTGIGDELENSRSIGLERDTNVCDTNSTQNLPAVLKVKEIHTDEDGPSDDNGIWF